MLFRVECQMERADEAVVGHLKVLPRKSLTTVICTRVGRTPGVSARRVTATACECQNVHSVPKTHTR